MQVLLNDINFDDRYFRISRDYIDQGLMASIRNFGVLDPPVVMQVSGKFRVVFGFNRLRILGNLGHEAVPAVILDRIEPEWYIKQVILKCQRNECGPVGRLKILVLLKDAFSVDSDRMAVIGEHGLHIPEDFIVNGSFLNSVMNLPDSVKRYIDCKDIQYKIIRRLADLPRYAIDSVAGWLDAGMLRVNIFKSIVDMIADICARDGNLSRIDIIQPDASADLKRWDDYLFERIYRARYPAYTSLKTKADDIVQHYSSRGIRIDYPPYFEGDSLKLTVTLQKRDNPDMIMKKMNAIDTAKLKELLDLL
jgi:hypothetical protein